jgi:hypothetical protein
MRRSAVLSLRYGADMRRSWNRTAALLTAAAVPALVLAGCSEPTGGSATGVATSAPLESSATAAPSSSTAVSRPRTFDMAAVADPCVLVPEAIRTRFDLPSVGIPGENMAFSGSKSCGFGDSSATWNTTVSAVTSGTPDFYRETGEVEEVQVAGFPAVVAPDETACYVGVDVHDEQMLDVISGSRKGLPQDELCSRAKAVAEAAIGVLTGG